MKLDSPFDLLTDRISLYGFAYPLQAGAQVRTPVLKKCNMRCMVQDAQPQVVSWYWQRQEKINNSLYLCDTNDYDLIDINDRVVFDGQNYRVKGRHNLAGRSMVFRIDLEVELEGNV